MGQIVTLEQKNNQISIVTLLNFSSNVVPYIFLLVREGEGIGVDLEKDQPLHYLGKINYKVEEPTVGLPCEEITFYIFYTKAV